MRESQNLLSPLALTITDLLRLHEQMDFPDGMPKNIVGAEYWVQERRGGDTAFGPSKKNPLTD